ncbi:MAG: DNA gyrase C-terminal beta-propeller domain-containing protein, partial [Archaeoglobaceae archaeon]
KSGRGAMGVIAHKINEKTGKLVLSEFCGKELFAFSHEGYCIRVEIEKIPIYGRNSAGVIVSKKGIKKALVI